MASKGEVDNANANGTCEIHRIAIHGYILALRAAPRSCLDIIHDVVEK